MTAREVLVSRYSVEAHSGNKAPRDVRTVARVDGLDLADFAPFGTDSSSRLRRAIASAGEAFGVLGRLSGYDLAVVQYPCGRLNERILARSTVPTIALIHDIECERFGGAADAEYRGLERYAALIVHTEAMRRHVLERVPDARTVVLQCFDYLLDHPAAPAPVSERPRTIYFVGRLSADKAGFLYGLPSLALPMTAYGPGCELDRLPGSVQWAGTLSMDDPKLGAVDGFGLVWDGDSPSELVGQSGRYMRLNAPHKFSLYMALGLPVVVSAESALAEIVRSERIGLAVDTLADAAEQAAALSPDEWAGMTRRVAAMRDRVTSGDFTRTALAEARRLVDPRRPVGGPS